MDNIIKNKNIKPILMILTIILCLGISLGAVYFMYYKKDERLNSINNGLITIRYDEKSSLINMTSDVPLSDASGLDESRSYRVTLENTSKVPVKSKIKLELGSNNNIDLGAVRYGITIDNELVKKDYIREDLLLYEIENMLSGEVRDIKINFWIDYYYDKPNKIFEAKIIAEGENNSYIPTEPITVTFDADGGTITGDTTKQVYYHQNYGTLPTPTKEGYTFMGWNGKNLFNYEEILINNPDTVTQVELKGVQTISWINTNTTINQKFLQGYFKENTQYTFSGNIAATKVHNNYLKIVYNNKSEENVNLSNYIKETNVFYNVVFLSQNNMSVNYIRGLYNNNEQVYLDINSFQIEEGTKATEYEPYYITSNTTVVQNQNHTLKAIWKENS